jgi:isopentenyl-diphosphate delta-isomerase type 1
MTATEHVILVDENDNATGTAEKLQAHQANLRHRAFSVFVFRQGQGTALELLLQQRADDKYHSAGLWTNTCCSHPRPGEDIIHAGERRLQEEMNLPVRLKSLGWFHYIAHFDNGLVENEIDHVLVGVTAEENITPNPLEVQAYRWVGIAALKKELAKEPEKFTPWLKQALELVDKSF